MGHVLVWVDYPLAKDQVLLLYSIPIYHSSSSLGAALVSCAHCTWLLLILQAFSTSTLSSYVCISGCGLIPHRGKDPAHWRARYTHTHMQRQLTTRSSIDS